MNREENPSLIITNAIEYDGKWFYNPLVKADFHNSIIDGNLENEIMFQLTNNVEYNFSFKNSAIKIFESILNDFPNNFQNCYFNEDIEYVNISDPPTNFNLDSLSFAINKGNIDITRQYGIESDIIGNPRISNYLPDLGAFEYTIDKHNNEPIP